MDKYEYRVRAEEINALIEKKEYAEAVKVADTIDWRRVKSVMMLCKISDLYKINRRYEDSKEVLLLANERHPGDRKIIYSLCELCIKLEEIVQAVEYYKEFAQVAPRDTGRYILQYRLYEAQDVSLEERIAVLEEYKKRDYREKWAYELAYLYHRIGLATRCVEECDELILWFGEGRYVMKAMELKMLHEQLTPVQQEKYDRYKNRRVKPVLDEENNEVVTGKTASISIEGESANDATLPISIKSVEVTNAPTAKIPSRKIREEIVETNDPAVERAIELRLGDQSTRKMAMEAPEKTAQEASETQEIVKEELEQELPEEAEATEEETTVEENPSTEEAAAQEDMDIKIKPIDVGEYNTINLQQELAKNLANLLAEEDMEAMDATKALPIETILESTDPNLMKQITGDVVKDTLVAPLLQNTDEMRPITEEDLLASLSEKPKTVDEINAAEEVSLEVAEPEAITVPETEIEQEATPVPKAETEQIATPVPEAETEQIATPVPEAETEQIATPVPEAEAEPEAIPAKEAEAEPEAIPAKEAEAEPEATPVPEAETEPEASTPRTPTGVTTAIKASVMNMDELLTTLEDADAARGAQEEATEIKPGQPTGVTTAIEASVMNMDELLNVLEDADDKAAEKEEVKAVSEPLPEQPAATEENQEQMVEKQITGQLSFNDIMAEWEETKKASEEKHREEMKQRVLRQTGNMFADFDATARASVSSDLDLISPMEDVFHDTDALATEVENAIEADLKEDEKKNDDSFANSLFQGIDTSEKVSEPAFEEEEPVKTKIFNTAEIRGIEAQLLSNLEKESGKVEPELVIPNITSENTVPEPLPQEPAVTEISSLPEEIQPSVEVTESVASKEAPVTNSIVATGEIHFTDLSDEQVENQSIDTVRELTSQEKDLFNAFLQKKEVEDQIAYAIDTITLTPTTGNVFITGATGSGTMDVSKNLIKIFQTNNKNFSKKVAKITGSILDKKDIKATLEGMENGALIVEKAGDLTPHVCENIVRYLQELPADKGVILFFEDTRGSIDKLLVDCSSLKDVFNVRIDIASLDNDGLVNYGKEYAKEKEFAIDDMGMLALYTRISDMQTSDHQVTVDEVRSIVDSAIANATKKSVTHFVDVIFAKRYDEDDMIILREKDFLKDR